MSAKKSFSSYAKRLSDPRWQKLRLQIFERDQWRCTNCGSATKTLSVHHKGYLPGHAPWEYSDSNFLSLCDDCHIMAERSRFILLSLLDNDEITQKLIVTAKAMKRTLFDGVNDSEKTEDEEWLNDKSPSSTDDIEEFFNGIRELLEERASKS